MSRFKHSHVMGLIGVCLDAGSAPFIIMPYMSNGSLLKYLSRERKKIVILDNDIEDEVCNNKCFFFSIHLLIILLFILQHSKECILLLELYVT